MAEIYWYISKAKLELLKEPGFLDGISVKLGFHLAGLSGEVSGTDPASLTKELKHTIKGLSESGQTFKDFNELGDDEAAVMVRFEGNAVRHVTGEEYWLAMEGKRTALLLAGSVVHAIGHPSRSPKKISPSVDPVNAFLRAFEKRAKSNTLSGSLSNAWREIMGDDLSSKGALPAVKGLAVFARSVPTDKRQMELADRENIERLVVGSPVYIQQI